MLEEEEARQRGGQPGKWRTSLKKWDYLLKYNLRLLYKTIFYNILKISIFRYFIESTEILNTSLKSLVRINLDLIRDTLRSIAASHWLIIAMIYNVQISRISMIDHFRQFLKLLLATHFQFSITQPLLLLYCTLWPRFKDVTSSDYWHIFAKHTSLSAREHWSLYSRKASL